MRLVVAVATLAMLTAAAAGQSLRGANSFVPGRLWDGKTPGFENNVPQGGVVWVFAVKK